jgi:1-deoxy-D-xylulose-5-phosphate reductoisomerase
VFHAAYEEAVAAFHAGALGYLEILETVTAVVEDHQPACGEMSRESVWEAEEWARATARARIGDSRG